MQLRCVTWGIEDLQDVVVLWLGQVQKIEQQLDSK
jgi:hypothetical protein